MNAKIFTIDGPSGVGKGTLAQLLAEHYGFKLLDSGALYRLTALNAKRLLLNPSSAEDAATAVADLKVTFRQGKTYLHEKDVSQMIRTEEIGQLASKIAVHSVVREKLFEFMQGYVAAPGIIADGRDMGIVVFTHADLKIFLTASAEVRAKRRYKQLKENGKDVNLSAVLSELCERDKRDENRSNAPLKPAKDAVVIDTSLLDVSQVFAQVKILVTQRGLLP